jgi:hypothetical protein
MPVDEKTIDKATNIYRYTIREESYHTTKHFSCNIVHLVYYDIVPVQNTT